MGVGDHDARQCLEGQPDGGKTLDEFRPFPRAPGIDDGGLIALTEDEEVVSSSPE